MKKYSLNWLMYLIVLPSIGLVSAFYHQWDIATFSFVVAIWVKL